MLRLILTDYETVDATKTLEGDTLSIEPDYPTQSFEIPVTIITEAGPVTPSTTVPEETTTEVRTTKLLQMDNQISKRRKRKVRRMWTSLRYKHKINYFGLF